MNNKGFTIVELMVGLVFLVSLTLLGGAVYAIIHFVGKFW